MKIEFTKITEFTFELSNDNGFIYFRKGQWHWGEELGDVLPLYSNDTFHGIVLDIIEEFEA